MPIETLSPSPVSCGSVEQLASTNCKLIPVRHILWNRTNCSMAKFMSKRCLRCWTKNNFFTFFTLSIVQELVDRIRWGRSYLLTKRSYRLSIQFLKFRSLLQKSEKIRLLLKRVPRLQQLFWGDFASGCGRAEFPGSNLVSGNFFHQLLTEKRSGKKETWNGTFKTSVGISISSLLGIKWMHGLGLSLKYHHWYLQAVWPGKNRQMSIKVAQKWLH